MHPAFASTPAQDLNGAPYQPSPAVAAYLASMSPVERARLNLAIAEMVEAATQATRRPTKLGRYRRAVGPRL